MNAPSVIHTQVQRTPRLVPDYPEGELRLENPAPPSEKPEIPWVQILVPPLATAATGMVMSIFFKSYIFLISSVGMTVIMTILSILNYNQSIKKHKEQNKKLERKYMDYLYQARHSLLAAAQRQRESMLYAHPPLEECHRIVRHGLKQLWERTSIEPDFLDVRMGVGQQPLALVPRYYSRTGVTDEEIPVEKIAFKLCEERSTVRDIPVRLPVFQLSTLGLFGKIEEVRSVIRSLAVHMTTHHGYDEVHLAALYRKEEAEHWEWLRWLPHTWNKNRSLRYLATTPREAADLSEELLPVLQARMKADRGGVPTRKARLPYYIFLVAAPELLEGTELMKLMLANDPALGITAVFAADRIDSELPLTCQAILEVKGDQGILRKDRTESLDDSLRQFTIDRLGRDAAEAFARMLAPIRIKEASENNAIPGMVTFLDSFEARRVEELEVLQRWRTNQVNRTLSIPLGRGVGGKLLRFDMHERAYGPHGLVAGTTGAGKSELLQSLLLGLAVNYHPHEVAFVLIDYKGGGMANAFEGLPHLVGTITNLGGNQINRALASIKSELLRRQRLFGEAGVNQIDDYIGLYQEGMVVLPLPHLIMVVDEFAELKTDQPEFMKELVSAARVGRSLGVHLILATQKPSGVVDEQIWSNSRFKLCLKVQNESDSNEMLKRPEAADIREKGRCYMQVGNNEVFTLFQSSWSGAPYRTEGGEGSAAEADLNPRMISLTGHRQPLLPKAEKEASGKPQTQLQMVVKHIVEAAGQQGIKEAFQLWLPPLPEYLSLTELLPEGSGWNGQEWRPTDDGLTAPAGLVDDPSRQHQFPLKIDFAKDGHLLLYGAPGSGKTMFLKTLIVSLAKKYRPDQVHFYLLDYGTRTMGVFHELPHLGEILYPEDEEKLLKLTDWLQLELEDRKRKFAKLGISSFQAYLSATGENVPAIMLILDNYAGLSENYPDTLQAFNKLVREGGSYGIYFISTGNSVNAFSYRLSQNVKQSLAFQMADRSDYLSIVGRTEGLEPGKVPGRGLVRDRVPLEFHAALPVPGRSDDQIADGIRSLCRSMKEAWGSGVPAKAVIIAPEQVSLEQLMDAFRNSGFDGPPATAFPLGFELETMQPVCLELSRAHSCLLSYYGEEVAYLELLGYWLSALTRVIPNSRTAVFQTEGSGLAVMGGPPMEYITDKEHFLEYTRSLVEELQSRKNAVRKAAESADGPIREADYTMAHYPLQILCIPRLLPAIECMEEESLGHLERIARYGMELGVLLLIGSEADELNRLQLLSTLAGALISGPCALTVGGRPGQHLPFLPRIGEKPEWEPNRSLREGEGLLFLEERLIKVKLPSH